MQDGSRASRRHRRTALSVIGVAVSALVLAACSSSPSGGGSTTPTGNSGGGPQGGGNASQAAAVAIAITPTADQKTSPTTPIVVKATNGTLNTVTVANTAKGTQVTGTLSPDKKIWTSTEPLAYGASYAVDAMGAGTDGKSTEQKSTVNTVTPTKIAFPNMIPAPSSVASTGVGIGQPVVFQFDQPVSNRSVVQQALTVTTTPTQTGAWYWINSKEVHYRAQTYWQAGTTIHVVAKVYGLDFGKGVFGAEDRDVTYHVHDSWVAKADASTEHMGIYHNGALLQTMAVSMGKTETPTHNGPHVISAKQTPYVMNSCTYGVCPPDPRAYKATEFLTERISNDGEFVHENPNSVSAQGHTNVSHGCINLNPTDAQTFFNEFGIGDVVEVTNSVGPNLPLFDTYGDWEVPWATWQAGNASA